MTVATWPRESRYHVPGLVNPKHIQRLLHEETTYDCDPFDRDSPLGRILTLVCNSNGTTETRILKSLTEDEMFVQSQSSSVTEPKETGATIVLAVEQKRWYFDDASEWSIQLHKDRWIRLLKSHSMFPPALHIMYDNNGGHGEHVSGCKRTGQGACLDQHAPHKPCAYHTFFKLGDWGNEERFAYFRHDFHTRRNFVLLAGTQCLQQVEEIQDRLEGVEEPVDLFIIVLAVLSCWHGQLESDRGVQDVSIGNIEKKTGHSSFDYQMVEPLTPAQLKLTKDIAVTSDNIQGCIKTATNLEVLLQFAITGCDRFHALSQPDPLPSLPSGQGSQSNVSAVNPALRRSQTQLISALEQVHSQVVAQKLQMQEQAYRIRSQFDIINSLISQSDGKASIDMAATSLADTTIMRDITLVTYLFLPGTFLATFFSMVFLNSSDSGDGIMVSKWIWVYFVCAVPLTVGMGWKFGSTYLSKVGWFKKFRDSTDKHEESAT